MDTGSDRHVGFEAVMENTSSSTAAASALCSHQDTRTFNHEHSHRESIPTKLQVHCTVTRARGGHTDLPIFGLVRTGCAYNSSAPV